ncbi:MAG: nitroreductase family protein [Desulfosarcinaceae bacterium]|nr:nitroreductase family protein [Desulfosarcinaceae bacterium]
MTELLPEIAKRRANRALSDTPVSADTLARIMTAATYAPSCFNNQSWRYLVLNEAASLAKVHPALSEGNYWAQHAPVLIVVATRADLDCRLSDGREYALFDCGLATQNLLLQAVKEGLFAHPMAGFDPVAVKSAFDIPETYTVITLVAIGYPGEGAYLSDKHQTAETSARSRKPENEVIAYNRWTL